ASAVAEPERGGSGSALIPRSIFGGRPSARPRPRPRRHRSVISGELRPQVRLPSSVYSLLNPSPARRRRDPFAGSNPLYGQAPPSASTPTRVAATAANCRSPLLPPDAEVLCISRRQVTHLLRETYLVVLCSASGFAWKIIVSLMLKYLGVWRVQEKRMEIELSEYFGAFGIFEQIIKKVAMEFDLFYVLGLVLGAWVLVSPGWRLYGFRRHHSVLEDSLIEDEHAKNPDPPINFWLLSWFAISVAASVYWLLFFWMESKVLKSAETLLWSDLNEYMSIMILLTIVINTSFLLYLCALDFKKTLVCLAIGTTAFTVLSSVSLLANAKGLLRDRPQFSKFALSVAVAGAIAGILWIPRGVFGSWKCIPSRRYSSVVYHAGWRAAPGHREHLAMGLSETTKANSNNVGQFGEAKRPLPSVYRNGYGG
ncbi:hypothetical protein EJB05_38748, partial [Eragrostis curvula]